MKEKVKNYKNEISMNLKCYKSHDKRDEDEKYIGTKLVSIIHLEFWW